MESKKEIKRISDWFFDFQQRNYNGKIFCIFPCNKNAKPSKLDDEFFDLFFTANETKRYLFESPDAYVYTKKFGIVMEHFQVDFSKHTSKGSLIRQKKINSDNLEKSILDGKISFELLAENIKKTYEDHTSKIPIYKEHLSKNKTYHKKNEVCFVIEDTTRYGAIEDKNVVLELSKRIAIALSQIEKPVSYNFYMFIVGGKPQIIFARAEEIKRLAKRIKANSK